MSKEDEEEENVMHCWLKIGILDVGCCSHGNRDESIEERLMKQEG